MASLTAMRPSRSRGTPRRRGPRHLDAVQIGLRANDNDDGYITSLSLMVEFVDNAAVAGTNQGFLLLEMQ